MTDVKNSKSEPVSNGDSNILDITPVIKRNNRSVLKNYYLIENSQGKFIKYGFDAIEIFQKLKDIVGDWPRSINGRLFIPPNGKARWLDKSTALFGWLSSEGIGIDWEEKTINGITKAEFLAALHGMVTTHTNFSDYPHFPPKPGYYYPPLELPASDGAFEQLLDFFRPVERDLLRAAFMTLFWGGPAGKKPAFIFTGLEDGKEKGTGVGKTTLMDVMADLAGGYVDTSSKLDIDSFKKRLLTAGHAKVVRMDNVKASKLSNAEMESLITSPIISGHRMFHGEGAIPNDFIYLFSFNDASLSRDLAERSVMIKLQTPEYSPTWEMDLFNFLKDNKLKVIAGIKELFEKDPIESTDFIRFPLWTKEVLNRATQKTDLIATIKASQQGLDGDDDLREDIEAIITHQISKYYIPSYGLKGAWALETEGEAFLIRCGLVNQWVAEGLNLKNVSNQYISKLIKRSKLRGHYDYRTIRGYPYFVWSHDQYLSTIGGAWKVIEDARKDGSLNNFSQLEKKIETGRTNPA